MKPKYKVGDKVYHKDKLTWKNVIDKIDLNKGTYSVTMYPDNGGVPESNLIYDFNLYEEHFLLDKESIWNNEIKEIVNN